MQVNEFLRAATQQLEAAGIGTARLDALVLLEDSLGRERAHLLAHPELELSPEHIRSLNAQINRRALHEPLAYIRGKTEFYGREFAVNKNVLEPRPESETMIDLVKTVVQNEKKLASNRPLIADVGSGSGCLGITAALELGIPDRVHFYDIDTKTLAVAEANARRLAVTGEYFESDLMSKSSAPYDIILANLPYVPDGFHINEAAMREPSIAIFGGPDGLDLYRQLFRQLYDFPWKPVYVLTEALPPQHQQLSDIARSHGFILVQSEDFIQVFSPA